MHIGKLAVFCHAENVCVAAAAGAELDDEDSRALEQAQQHHQSSPWTHNRGWSRGGTASGYADLFECILVQLTMESGDPVLSITEYEKRYDGQTWTSEIRFRAFYDGQELSPYLWPLSVGLFCFSLLTADDLVFFI